MHMMLKNAVWVSSLLGFETEATSVKKHSHCTKIPERAFLNFSLASSISFSWAAFSLISRRMWLLEDWIMEQKLLAFLRFTSPRSTQVSRTRTASANLASSEQRKEKNGGGETDGGMRAEYNVGEEHFSSGTFQCQNLLAGHVYWAKKDSKCTLAKQRTFRRGQENRDGHQQHAKGLDDQTCQS